MTVAALVLAAGRGERLGHALPKAFVPLAGRPLLLHALAALTASPAIERVVPVLAQADFARFDALRPALRALGEDGGRGGEDPMRKLAEPVAGGAERQDSVAAGVAALPAETTWIAVHDAARPLVRPADVTRVVEVARRHGAALLAVPVRDTIKRGRDGVVVETPDRAACFAAQTPQVFRAELLREALAKAAADGVRATDDAALVERLGVGVRIVAGDPENLKITSPGDLLAAEAWLRARAGAPA